MLKTPREMTRTATMVLALLATWAAPSSASAHDEAPRARPRKATFEVTNRLDVVPDGAKRLRVWFAMPQDDPAQRVRHFEVECSHPTRVSTRRDSPR
jgi:hypothetical protein